MPNISNRQRELEDIEFVIMQHSIDNDDDAEEEAILLYIMALSTRFIERFRKDKSKTNLHFCFREVFPHLSDAAFRSCFRTTKEGFKSLMDIFQGHDIFYNKSTSPQAHPVWKLAVALMRIGTYGNGGSAVRVEGTLYLGQGTVTLYTWCLTLFEKMCEFIFIFVRHVEGRRFVRTHFHKRKSAQLTKRCQIRKCAADLFSI
ncbi:MAG: hypothetical protein BYD32DRAFT_248470 [Podila humilis]|nr:MAG: hypothetical protein BYD32DRAFT_248470 [Podila humilis]